MPPSYFEKLLWSFIKNRIFGGVFLFIRLDVVPLTMTMVITIILEYYLKTRFIIVPIYAFLLIIIGLLLRKRMVNPIYSTFLAVILLFLIYSSIMIPSVLVILPEEILSIIENRMLISALIFTWFLFNSVMLIIQIAEFFASTVGLYLLWGSDKKRIFLSPLPQLTILGLIYLCFRTYLIDLISTILISVAVASLLLSIYGVLRESGRILRSSIAIYIFFEAYMIVNYVYKSQIAQNIIYWVALTLLAMFFTAQGRAAIMAKEKRGVNGNIYLLIGILLLISHALTPINGGFLIDFELWWLLSILATIVAPILFIIYIQITGKIKWYVARDNTPTHKLFIEVAKIVGAKVIGELVKVLSSSVISFTKSFRSDEKG